MQNSAILMITTNSKIVIIFTISNKVIRSIECVNSVFKMIQYILIIALKVPKCSFKTFSSASSDFF